MQYPTDAKIFYENPFVTRVIKQNGMDGVLKPTGMTNVVLKYLEYDMVISISIIIKF